MATKSPQKLVLLDVHAIIHRAYHAVPNLSSSSGLPTGALYGLLNMILKMIKDLSPDYIIACYDLPQKTFRHETYDAYKKGRKQTEDALKVQIDQSRHIFEALAIPMYDAPGFEADDILGTIVTQTNQQYKNIQTVIVSGDMDTLQLVEDDRVLVYTMKKGIHDTILYNQEKVQERFLFTPKQIPDFKGLRGDPSDNIIGVPGIGEKTATELILHFSNIENIYKTLATHPEKLIKAGIKQRIVDLLQEHQESALFSKTLATIRDDAPIAFTLPTDIFAKQYRPEKIVRLIREYEFRTLVPKFEQLHNNEPVVFKEPPTPQQQSDHAEILETASVGLWVLNSEMVHPTEPEILQETETTNLTQALEVIHTKLANENLTEVFTKIEKPLIPIIQKMKKHGILIDTKILGNLSQDYHKQLERLSKEVFAITENEFNINSPKQLSEILFDQLKLPPKGKKNKTGNYSTRSEVLEELIDQHPIIQKIIDYRELQKLVSTYIDVLPGLLDEQHRLHAEFLQHGTTTGRFSSQNPNLQNIPIRSDLGRAIRNAFIAPPGHKLVAADYSQIELRVLALFSGDPILRDVFLTGRDIHTAVASRVFHIDEDRVTKNQRRDAKVINFGIIYGMGITALQKNLGTTRREAEEFYEAYFNEFPDIKNYLNSIKTSAKKTLMTKTLFGRVRRFPMFTSKLPFIQAIAERTAVNAPIQGTAADIIKLAMIDVDAMIQKNGWDQKIYPMLQIHDELVYEVPDELVDAFSQQLKHTMNQVLETHQATIDADFADLAQIPLEVSVETGPNFGELVPLSA